MASLASQPLKGLYILGAITFELVRLPLYVVKFLSSYGRPHADWTFRQALTVHICSGALAHSARVHLVTPLPLTPGAEKERFVVIKPGKEALYVGPLRSNADVKPVDIGGTWFPAPLSSGSNKSNIRVVFHIHGGAFVIGDGRTQSNKFLAKQLIKHATATHVFSPQYRLSTLPVSKTSNPFPAAFQDSLTAYLYLINDLQISPKDIILSGDSAGGNLVISFLRYLAEYGADLNLPNPAAAFLWSPWINPADTSCSYVYDNKHYATDYLSPPFTHWGSAAYAGLAGTSILSQPYITHKTKMFKTEVPLHVNTGGAEVLYFDDTEWAENMKKAGNDVDLYVERLVPHDILALGNVMGFQKEATNSVKKAGEWVRNRL